MPNSGSGPRTYSVTKQLQFEKFLYVIWVDITLTPEIIPMLLGDFVCCLRSSLDQLAWRLSHLPPIKTFNRTQERQIHFPIFETRNSTYEDRRSLFPPAVADVIDTFQPYLRGNAFRDDPLWQLNELWTLDKHRTIPLSPYSLDIGFALDDWQRFVTPPNRSLNHHLEVIFPLGLALAGGVNLEPSISVEILFGDSSFEISFDRLRQINDFVRNEVIPRFAGFFRKPQIPMDCIRGV